MSDKQYFTLVFEGNIQDFKGNPLKTETVFGVPVAVGKGNAFDEIERLSSDCPFDDMDTCTLEPDEPCPVCGMTGGNYRNPKE